jgi:exodeoxyribonuclease V gamma subunit
MALELITGNRMERLFEDLVRELRGPLRNALSPETVIVHGPAMQRWLSLRLARALGICANTRFDYPNAIISYLTRRVFPDQPEASPFEPDILTWRIMALLDECVHLDAFAPISAYLQEATPRMVFQLAHRISAAFDQYLIYRPDMIEAWQAGRLTTGIEREEVWQAELWRRLNSAISTPHRLALVSSLFEALERRPQLKQMLPERLSIFGISYLPPFHLEFFNRLSAYVPVRMYALNPCCEYWGDIVSEGRAARLSSTADPDDMYFEQGHALLAAWGAHGREFFNRTVDMDLSMKDCFDDALPQSMLGFVQADILKLIDRRGPESEQQVCAAADRSVQVHSCHSAMRELEVLRDCLLDLFSGDTDLNPDDVLVLTPDMQLYAPCIQAVFGAPGGVKLPFSIADRALGASSGMVRAFEALLRLPGSRMRVSDMLPVLECPAVQRRFGLSLEDVEVLQEWIQHVRICWGLDKDDRRAAGVPAAHENTWRFGLDRMLLGYAMDEADGMFEGVLACDGMQGEAARLAGALADILEHLNAFRQATAGERTLAGWSALLQDLLQRFFDPAEQDRYAWDHLQRCAARPVLLQQHAGFDQPLAFEMLRELLAGELTRVRHPAGFFSGAVTFAEMQPMRGIPFRVVCLIGMNDHAFPRQSFAPGFNLLPHTRRPGDRESGKDDRYIFLEVLLSARDALIITYTGQSQHDSTILPSSVLVSELLDTLEQSCCIEDGSVREHVVYRHFLQPFNPAYFTPACRMHSFAEPYCACAQTLSAGPGQEPDFFDRPLSAPESLQLSAEDLARFFNNPLACMLRERLNIELDPQAASISERESFRLAGLDRYTLEQDLLADVLEGRDMDSAYARSAARGILPHGPAGRASWESSLRSVTSFVQTLNRAGLTNLSTDIHEVACVIDDCTLSAAVYLQSDGRLMRMRHAAIKPKDFLRIWLDYLVLSCAWGDQAPRALLAGLDPGKTRNVQVWHFDRVDDPHSVLTDLLGLYREGMCKPLPFMPQASFAYACALHDGRNEQQARAAALKCLARGDFNNSELDDVCYGRFFDECIVESPEFDRCACVVFGPLLEQCHRIG